MFISSNPVHMEEKKAKSENYIIRSISEKLISRFIITDSAPDEKNSFSPFERKSTEGAIPA